MSEGGDVVVKSVSVCMWAVVRRAQTEQPRILIPTTKVFTQQCQSWSASWRSHGATILVRNPIVEMALEAARVIYEQQELFPNLQAR